jgi:F-box protein 11
MGEAWVSVYIVGKATATLEDNEIHFNTAAGVFVQGESSQALLKSNRIHDGKHVGVYIEDKATATLEDNNIHTNIQSGVGVRGEGSQALLKGNLIHGG